MLHYLDYMQIKMWPQCSSTLRMVPWTAMECRGSCVQCSGAPRHRPICGAVEDGVRVIEQPIAIAQDLDFFPMDMWMPRRGSIRKAPAANWCVACRTVSRRPSPRNTPPVGAAVVGVRALCPERETMTVTNLTTSRRPDEGRNLWRPNPRKARSRAMHGALPKESGHADTDTGGR
jgi:hypothetical protein